MKKKGTYLTILLVFAMLITSSYLRILYYEKQSQNPKIYIIIRYDDFGSISRRPIESKILEIHQKYNLSISFATIPFAYGKGLTNESKEFIENWSRRVNIEITCHGYVHDASYIENKNLSYPYSEFYGKSYEEQFRLINSSKNELERAFNRKIDGFIPPCNTYDYTTLKVLDDLDFLFISAYNFTSLANEAILYSDLHFYHAICCFVEIQKFVKNTRVGLLEPTVICIYFHDLDFEESGQGFDNINLSKYEKICKWISTQRDLQVITFQDLENLKISPIL